MGASVAIPRIDKESRMAYQALMDYLAMGSVRSLSKLLAQYQTYTKPPPTKYLNTLKSWSDKNEWQKRIKQYLDDIEAEAADKVRQRLLAMADRDYEDGDKLRQIAMEVLAAEAPNFYRTTRKVIPGKPQVVDVNGKIIQPGTAEQVVVMVRLDVSNIIRAVRNGSDLQHRSVPKTTEISPADENGRVIITETINIPATPPELDLEPDEAEDDDSPGAIPG